MLEAFIDAPLRHRHLTVFPVIAPRGPVLPYLLSTEEQEAEITELLGSFPIHRQQVGSLTFLGDQFLGLEALGSASLYAPLHRRLLMRFIKEALNAPSQLEGNPFAMDAEAQMVVDATERADRVGAKKVGLGDYLSLTGPVSGGELIHQGHWVHLSVRPALVGAATGSGEGASGQCS